MANANIKHRNVFVVYLLMIFTFGIYGLVWTVKTKREMNSLGGEIPTTWLLLVPFVGFYYLYRYNEAFAKHVAKDDAPLKWFAIHIFLGFLTPYFVQKGLNAMATPSEATHSSQATAA